MNNYELTIKLTPEQEEIILDSLEEDAESYYRAKSLFDKSREIRPGQSFLEENEKIEDLIKHKESSSIGKVAKALFKNKGNTRDFLTYVIKYENELANNSNESVIHAIHKSKEVEIK